MRHLRLIAISAILLCACQSLFDKECETLEKEQGVFFQSEKNLIFVSGTAFFRKI